MDNSGSKPSFSLPSLIAVGAAIASFVVGAFWGFVLALIAIFFGMIGVLLSFSSRIRGGFVSFFSLGAGLLGIIAALFKAVMWLGR